MNSNKTISKNPQELKVKDLVEDHGEINSLREALEILLPMTDRNYLPDQIPAWRSTYFRGEDRLYEIPLLPSRGRNLLNHLYPDCNYENRPHRDAHNSFNENEFKEHRRWYREVRELEGISSSLSDTDLMMEARHYGLSTRLLDWSTDPFVSLWFACNGARYIEDKDTDHFFEDDAAVYVFHAYIFGNLNEKVKSDPYLTNSNNIGYYHLETEGRGDPFTIISADANYHAKQRNQSSIYTIHAQPWIGALQDMYEVHRPQLERIDGRTEVMKRYTIPAKSKWKIFQQLNQVGKTSVSLGLDSRESISKKYQNLF